MIDDFRYEYEFLSNFYPSIVTWEGQEYKTVEHAYQAAKTTNQDEVDKVRLAPTPGIAKRVGQNVTLRPDWEKIKFGVMLNLVRQKFQDQHLQEKLLSTGQQRLIEGNWWGDQYWGVCKGKGENRLGIILMQVRQECVELQGA